MREDIMQRNQRKNPVAREVKENARGVESKMILEQHVSLDRRRRDL